jgi:hypothetical protein
MSGLQLGKKIPIGVGAQEAQSIQARWDTADDSDRRVIGTGLVDHPKPEFSCPDLDADTLTTPDSRSYTETYVHILAWFNYSNELLANVQARVLQYDNMLRVLTAQTRIRQREISAASGAKKMPEEEIQDLLYTNPEYQNILLELQRYKQLKLMMESKVDAIERSLKVISRQVEIRKLDIEQQKNANNMPTRGYTRDPRVAPTLGGR